MTELTLLRQQSPLANPRNQLQILAQHGPSFSTILEPIGSLPLTPTKAEILQINVGRVCNQTCRHCHVDAGPDRRESMSSEVIDASIALLKNRGFSTLDITGGAPEMHPQFRNIVERARASGKRVIDRCNLTILLAPGFRDLPAFLAEHQVEIVASLPCYLESNVDSQRGDHVFERSIQALQQLNSLGYGRVGSALKLTLVYNPTGPSLPPPQAKLEADYRRELMNRFGIEFTQLFTITNLPISRFLADLHQSGRLEAYQQKLIEAFNPATIEGLMCRNTLSIDWQGYLYDCDFNQMLDLPVSSRNGQRLNVVDLNDETWEKLQQREIITDRHCFGCTAGAGSSCQGSLTP